MEWAAIALDKRKERALIVQRLHKTCSDLTASWQTGWPLSAEEKKRIEAKPTDSLEAV